MTDSFQFSGFPKEGFMFLNELKQNNNRDWFNAHKATYKKTLEEPAKAYFEAMKTGLEELVGNRVRGKIFRFYRDVRFSKDKTPFNTHVRMSFTSDVPDSRCMANPGFYFSLEPQELIFGTGFFEFPKEFLSVYQLAVADDDKGTELVRISEHIEGIGGRLDGPQYKRVPSGFDPDHPNGNYLRYKGLVAWRNVALPQEIYSTAAVQYSIEQFRPMLALYRWLQELGKQKN